ncbi:MAG: hypothetical protein KA902_02540 [Arenimonas sp.]|nr:hypothetical protein [Arenimonas sp.]
MIRLFNSARRKQLQESRMVHYLLYAMGEIILVVVGILIALQVNNWNEARKARAFEVVILQEIRENIRGNLERFRGLQRRLQTSNAGANLLLNESAKPQPDRERLEHYFSILNTGIVFSYNRGAYDSVKAAGLDRLSNRTLRSSLIGYFDSFMPRNERFIQNEYVGILDERISKIYDFSEPFITRDANGLQRVEMRFADNFNWSSHEFLSLLATYSQANDHATRRLDRVVAETESLLTELDMEIDGKAQRHASQLQKNQLPASPKMSR